MGDVDPVKAADAVPGAVVAGRAEVVDVPVARVILFADSGRKRERAIGVVVVVGFEEELRVRSDREEDGYQDKRHSP
jgi:hypothetical protein